MSVTTTEEEPIEKSAVEQSRDVISQLKEMEHYAKTNMEKLSGFWFLLTEEIKLDDETKQKYFANRLDSMLSHQGRFHDELTELISDYEIECNRIVNEA